MLVSGRICAIFYCENFIPTSVLRNNTITVKLVSTPSAIVSLCASRGETSESLSSDQIQVEAK